MNNMDKEILMKFIYRILRHDQSSMAALEQLREILIAQNAPEELSGAVAEVIDCHYDAVRLARQTGTFTAADIAEAKRRKEQRLEEEHMYRMYGRC